MQLVVQGTGQGRRTRAPSRTHTRPTPVPGRAASSRDYEDTEHKEGAGGN